MATVAEINRNTVTASIDRNSVGSDRIRVDAQVGWAFPV